ncbi:MAG: leucine--tRNA ligase [Pseudomonadales bacterium]|nr:leucine--tRNA ligase [Pseudomonadales bacterium]
MDSEYLHGKIEQQSQEFWEAKQSFLGSDTPSENPFYCLSMFPYPSGQLHMGHVRVYTLGDVIGRYQRLKGKDVFQPMGWDAFGLPAENAAIKNKIPPHTWTIANIDHMRSQLKSLGFAFDWSREFATCEPDYYRWEQWFFVRLFNKGLAYQKSSVVNWDPVDQTVLANEQVVDGKGWRSGAPVERREMLQWVIKITDYAQELLEDLDDLDWPEQVKTMQRNWIGRSEGIEIDFAVDNQDAGVEVLSVYTTRPDTLMGATYLAVAAEHPLAHFSAQTNADVAAFIQDCKNVKAAEAEIATMEKRGIDTGLTVKHPISGKSLPVWIANFVLMEYGSGAVMSVPGHDQRDWEFARKYQLDIVQVVAALPGTEEVCDLSSSAFVSRGVLVNSGDYNGLEFEQAFDAISAMLSENACGRRQVNYRLRDWGVSRQRYWGCPIPMIHCPECGTQAVPEQDLPVILPTDVEFEGVQSPLVKMDAFLNVPCPKCKGDARRETDTFDTFVESSWYYARFASSDNTDQMLDERARQWTPVDHYVGGIEHAILHLLYARFYHKLMRDEGLLDSDEPFKRLLMLGMVLQNGKKMSKSAGDAGDPQHLLEKYGADSLRLAMMFAAPPEQSFEWNENGVEGANRFLRRLWTFVYQFSSDKKLENISKNSSSNDFSKLDERAKNLRRKTHETLSRADDDYGRRHQFNTVVSGAMELVNALYKYEGENTSTVHEALSVVVLILSPIAPHICHALWKALGYMDSVHKAEWMAVDDAALVQDSFKIVAQVNGKVRGQLTVSANAGKDEIIQSAIDSENVAKFISGKEVRKAIYVPGKLVNLVVG